MRAILGLILLAIILAFVGWITIDTSSDRPSATIETQEIREDLNAISESVEAAGQEVEATIDENTAN